MLALTTYHKAYGEPSGSPFGVKAICLLQLSGLEWQIKYNNDPRKMPNAKLPVLNDDNQVIPDSDTIRAHLETKYKVVFDVGLSDQQKAVSRAVIRMTEEHLYFAAVCNRWLNDENWEDVRRVFFSNIPIIVNGIIAGKIRGDVRKAMKSQGMGRHSVDEQFKRADHDITAIQTLLSDKPFLFGDAPTAADASVVPMLRAIAVSVAKNRLNERVAEDSVLMAYLERGKDAMYPA